MKNTYLNWVYSYLLLFIFFSCSEKELQPISESLGKPGVVTDIAVEPSAGGATISYKIPTSEDLLAVKCVYTTSNNKQYEETASYFENKLSLHGYNDTLEHVATLYAVNRAQEISDPIKVKFRPLESPLSKAIKTVKIDADFGGARFNWNNPEKVPLNIEFLGPDTAGNASTLNILTSDIDKNTYNIRGYDSELYQFSMIISDNYGNFSDTISTEILPMHEERLDKKKMSVMNLANDASLANWAGKDIYMIDDNVMTEGIFGTNALPGASMTFDLGVKAKLSRFVMFQRPLENLLYNSGNPRTMDVYVCDHKPDPSGDWSEWTKVMTCEIVKPSGSPGNTITDLDIEAALKGHDLPFDISLPPTQYVRIVLLTAWANTTYCAMGEIDFYGDIQE